MLLCFTCPSYLLYYISQFNCVTFYTFLSFLRCYHLAISHCVLCLHLLQATSNKLHAASSQLLLAPGWAKKNSSTLGWLLYIFFSSFLPYSYLCWLKFTRLLFRLQCLFFFYNLFFCSTILLCPMALYVARLWTSEHSNTMFKALKETRTSVLSLAEVSSCAHSLLRQIWIVT